jgi:glycosyltransferase involved in cell wall biosynthesis/SAM-dependent methyltransferase
MLIPSFYPLVGGAEQQASQLARKLIEKGLEIFIVTRRLNGTRRFEIINGVPVHRTFYKWHTLFFLSSAFSFLIRKRNDYDILHVHTMYSPALLACALKIILRKKVVVKVTRTGSGALINRLFINPLDKWRFKFLIRYVDCFIAVNREAKEALMKMGLGGNKVTQIPNGVDEDLFKPASWKEKEYLKETCGVKGYPIIVSVGRLIKRKRLDLLIDALPKIKENFPQVVLLVVGPGSEKGKLEQLAKRKGVFENTIFIGRCERERLLNLLKISDLFVLPSESEGIPNALLEAMAVGLPVIASKINGITDVISNEHDGLLFVPAEEKDLLEKVFTLLENEELRRKIGRKARETVEKRFSFEIIGQEYYDLYKKLTNLTQKPKSTPNYIKKWKETGSKRYLRAYYSRPEYKKIYEKPKIKWIRKFRVLADMMRLVPAERVLDVGCASKMLKPIVEEKGAVYKGVDIAESFEPDYLCDAEDMSIVPDNSFDWVVLSDVLEHLPSPEKALAEAHRIGRRVIAVLPNWYRLERIKFLPRSAGDRHLVRRAPKEWMKVFQRTGFKICKIKGNYYVPSIAFYPVKVLKGIDLLLRTKPFEYIGSIFDKYLSEKPIFRFLGQELIIVAERYGDSCNYSDRGK